MCDKSIRKPCAGSVITRILRPVCLVVLMTLGMLAGNNAAWAADSQAEVANVFDLPGQGINSIQYSPSHQLTQVVWKAAAIGESGYPSSPYELVYFVRQANGTWTEEVVISTTELRWWTSTRCEVFPTQLLYTSDGTPHIFLLGFDDDYIAHYQRSPSGWSYQESIAIPAVPAYGNYFENTHMIAVVGQDDSFHTIVVTRHTWGTPQQAQLKYGTNKNGAWSWGQVTVLESQDGPEFYIQPLYRVFSLAVDSNNFAHITFCPDFEKSPGNSGDRLYSKLAYGTNRSGSWTTETVFAPPDNSADAGLAASVAIGPNNQPAIASFFIERAKTGSAKFARLYYHTPSSGGGWDSQVIVKSPDGYAAGDGAKFTGFAPQLLFDSQGRPHIAFSDYASHHFSGFGAEEFSGQIRHAWNDGDNWNVETIYRQAKALANMMYRPSMAIGPAELAFTGIRRVDELGSSLEILSSTYSLVRVTIGASSVEADDTPPSPDPMTWGVVPHATAWSSISMTATSASDLSDVEYYFEETSGNPGGSVSGWQNSSEYNDIGLSDGTTYTYRVRVRDKSANQNETNWSDYGSATTPPRALGIITSKICKVKAGKSKKGDPVRGKQGFIARDGISLAGTMEGIRPEDLEGTIQITIQSADIKQWYTETIGINQDKVRKGKYSHRDKQKGISFKLDTNKAGKFSLKIKNADLTGLGSPLTLEIEIGSYYGAGSADETKVNGKKSIPIQLMSGYKDTLPPPLKIKAKNGKKEFTDSLVVKGGFSLKDEPSEIISMTLSLGGQSIHLTDDKGTFTYKRNKKTSKITSVAYKSGKGETPQIKAKFDFIKCSYSVSIKKTELETTSGQTTFGVLIDMALSDPDYNKSVEVDLD